MLLTLTSRHFSNPCDKAYPVEIRHPGVLEHIVKPAPVRLWWKGQWHDNVAVDAADVQTHGDGRCFIADAPVENRSRIVLWVSLPDNTDPRTISQSVVVAVGSANELSRSAKPIPDEDGPLLIIGPQRSGTTALQTALDAATRYKAPRDINTHPWNTLEGFFTVQSVQRLLQHRFTSPLGNRVQSSEFRTGLFDDSAFADDLLSMQAQCINNAFRLSTHETASWIDKSPGWEPVALSPIFKALFPSGKIIFMAREPESCVISIIRLEGRLHPSLDNPELIGSIGRNAAVWKLSHTLWRMIGTALIDPSSRLEVTMESLRGRESATIQAITKFLNLNDVESVNLTQALRDVPLAQHAQSSESINPAIPALIARLCNPGIEAQDDATAIPDDALQQARSVFLNRLQQMLVWLGMQPADALQAAQTIANDDHESAFGSREMIRATAGPLLMARLNPQSRSHPPSIAEHAHGSTRAGV